MISVFDHTSYRTYLGNVLEDKVKKNAAFSLRSFARNLELSPSHLSRVLSGSKKLSMVMAGRVAQRLQLGRSETSYFMLLIQLEMTKDEEIRAEILKTMASKSKSAQRKTLDLETFKTISDWHHFAIIALAKIPGFRNDPHWIARRLEIQPLEATHAINRLLNLRLLEQTPEGELRPVEAQDITTSDDIVSAAIRENHRQQLQRATTALNKQPVDIREFNNLAVAMRPKDMERAKKLIRDFVDKFNEEMDTAGGTEVFQLNVQFFQSTSA
jgi:uncharacterized protein (TIGR02147 family)